MEDLEGFEVFDHYRRRKRTSGQALVTLQQRGNLSLNAQAFQTLGSPGFVVLSFSRARRLIGISPADSSSSAHRIPVHAIPGEHYTIAGRTFSREYAIDTRVARRYTGKMQDGMLIIDLNGESEQVTGPRAKEKNEEAT